MENFISNEKYIPQSNLNGIIQTDLDKLQKLSLVERFEVEAMPHLPVMKQVAMKIARNQAEAEDLVQETFAQALKSFDSYQPGTNCRGWLCKIMFHKRSQWIRSNSRFCQFPEGEMQYPAATYATMLPTEFMSEKLALALFAIPDKFQQIVRLAVLEEFTYREISDKLDVPIGTVMSRMHRGRKMLRDNFFQYAGKLPA